MASRLPLVIADDGLVQQLQSGDVLSIGTALARLLEQNTAILRALARVGYGLEESSGEPFSGLSDTDVQEFFN